MAAAGQALMEVLGLDRAPMLSLTELQIGVMRVPWLGRLRNSEEPAFAAGLEGIDDEAAQVYLFEERPPVPGEPGAYRPPHLDEGGYRPGLHAILRSAGSPVGHAVAAGMGIALAREAAGMLTDASEAWVPASAAPQDCNPYAHMPEAFAEALRAPVRYATVADAAAALWARRPAASAARRASRRRGAPTT